MNEMNDKNDIEPMAYINHKIIKWLQDSLRLSNDEMAKVIGITTEDYEKLLNGNLLPTMEQLRNFAKKLDLSMLLFYLNHPPDWDYSTFTLEPDGDVKFLKNPITFDLKYDTENEKWCVYHNDTGLCVSGKTFDELRENIIETIAVIIDNIFNKGHGNLGLNNKNIKM